MTMLDDAEPFEEPIIPEAPAKPYSQSKEAPKVIIPATPEITMEGVEGVFTPDIMKCALGGWLIVVPGRGVAAKSTLEEAMAFLEDISYEIFGESKPTLPKVFDREPGHEHMESNSGWGSRMRGALNGMAALAIFVLGVKAA